MKVLLFFIIFLIFKFFTLRKLDILWERNFLRLHTCFPNLSSGVSLTSRWWRRPVFFCSLANSHLQVLPGTLTYKMSFHRSSALAPVTLTTPMWEAIWPGKLYACWLFLSIFRGLLQGPGSGVKCRFLGSCCCLPTAILPFNVLSRWL